jgi:vanillate/3-O-methylgallate O-demethylase
MTSGQISLQDLITNTPNLVEYLYNDVTSVHASMAGGVKPVPGAFSNWRDEQAAAAETAALLHQTYNMPSLFIKGPNALKLLKSIAVNTFENYGLDRGKQFVACAPNGYLIGDCILYRHGEESFELVSGAPVQNWVQYRAKSDGGGVEVFLDNSSNINPTGRRVRYRFELAGPSAKKIFDRLVDGGAPEIGFFRTRTVRMKGHDVFALRHGMVGSFAVELSGPFEEQPEVRSYILEVGQEFGLKPIGMDAYYSNVQSGWIPYPVPGIFTDPVLEDYRRSLPATTFEANYQLGGSFVSTTIEGYYATPYDYGYGNVIKFDHDFYGRDALQRVPDEARRQKVTLVWDRDDVMRVLRSQLGPSPRYKSIEFPNVSYAWSPHDQVRSRNGELVGISRHAAYQNPIGEVLSLAIFNREHAIVGSEVIIIWGEPGGGSRKPQVERHEQTTIRARIAPAPYATDTQRVAH